MSKITSAIAAALIASASFAGAALAEEGDYYAGAQPTEQAQSSQAPRVDSYGYTGSISRASGRHANLSSDNQVLNRGDYYDGANRPN